MPSPKESDKFPTEAEQAAWWAGYSASEQAVERLIEALIRVGNHAHGMPPSKGAGYIIAEVNSALAALERPS